MLPALLLCVVPAPPTTISEHCDLLEKNSFYNDAGELVFIQNIAWLSQPDGFHVFRWWMHKPPESVGIQRVGRRYVIRFDEGGVSREIWSSSYHESWEQHDKEVADQELVPVASRRPLLPPKRAPHE